MFQNAMPALVLLLAMMALAFVLKRWRKQIPGLSQRDGPPMQLLSALSLGPQQRLVTVRVGDGETGVCLVLGVAPGSVTTLHSLPLEALPAVPETGGGALRSGGFAARLAQLTKAPHDKH